MPKIEHEDINETNNSLDMIKTIAAEQFGNVMSIVSTMDYPELAAEYLKHSLWIAAITDEMQKYINRMPIA